MPHPLNSWLPRQTHFDQSPLVSFTLKTWDGSAENARGERVQVLTPLTSNNETEVEVEVDGEEGGGTGRSFSCNSMGFQRMAAVDQRSSSGHMPDDSHR